MEVISHQLRNKTFFIITVLKYVLMLVRQRDREISFSLDRNFSQENPNAKLPHSDFIVEEFINPNWNWIGSLFFNRFWSVSIPLDVYHSFLCTQSSHTPFHWRDLCATSLLSWKTLTTHVLNWSKRLAREKLAMRRSEWCSRTFLIIARSAT